MFHGKPDKWAFALLGLLSLYLVTRINWPDHWSYWATDEASALIAARSLAAKDPAQHQFVFSSSPVSSLVLSRIIKLSDDPAHLGRFFILTMALLTFLGWYYCLRAKLSPAGAWLGCFFAVMTPSILQVIDSLAHPGTDLILFFLIPSLLFFQERTSSKGIGWILKWVQALALFLGTLNFPHLIVFFGVFYAFFPLRDRSRMAFPLLCMIMGVAMHVSLSARFLSPGPAMPYFSLWRDYFSELLVLFGPAFLFIGAICLGSTHFLGGQGIKETAEPHPHLFGFAKSLFAAAVLFEFYLRVFSPESLAFPHHFYPFLTLLLGGLFDRAGILLEHTRLQKVVQRGLLIAVIAVRTLPNLAYLSQYPHSLTQHPTRERASGIPQTELELMKIMADVVKADSSPGDLWLVPARFGWNKESAHPFIVYWSERQTKSDGRHLMHFLNRVAELKKQMKGNRLYVLCSSHVSEIDIRQYLAENWKLLKEHSTVYGSLRIYAEPPPPSNTLG